MRTTILCAISLLFAACDSKPESKNEAVALLESAGLRAEGLTEANGMISGADCQQGKIDGIDAALCQFEDAVAAKAGEQSALGWVGEAHAGTAVSSGRALLVLADRGQKDPSGKRIDEITKAFKKQ
jgi:hypothetical protein